MAAFIEIHALQTLPPSCINRDDIGLPKTTLYGGGERIRVSSQCWKRAIRDDWAERVDPKLLAERTRRLPRLIADRAAAADPGLDPGAALAAAADMVEHGLGLGVDRPKDGGEPRLKSLYLIGRASIDALAARLPAVMEADDTAKAAKADGRELRAIAKRDARTAVDVALFGRMSADDKMMTDSGAVHFGHAYGIDEADIRSDFYAAVDDADRGGDAAMLGDIAFCSPTLYRYANVNLDMVSERMGAGAAAAAIRTLLESFVLTVPHGRITGFAQDCRPGFILIDVADYPASRASAFIRPVGGDPMAGGIARLERWADDEEWMYGLPPSHLWTIAPKGEYGPYGASTPLPAALGELTALIEGGEL